MPEKQGNSTSGVLYFFRSAVAGRSGETRAAYGRVVKSFEGFLASQGLEITYIPETAVTDWAVELLRSGLAPKTVAKYADILAALSNAAVKAGVLSDNEGVRAAKARISGCIREGRVPKPEGTESFFARFAALMRVRPEGVATAAQPDAAVWRDVILLSLLNGGMDLADAACLTKDAVGALNDESRAVASRNESPRRRKYVFDLGQSSKTPGQFAGEVRAKTLALLRDRVSPSVADPQAAVRSMWVETAMRSGATASAALGCQPAAFRSLTLPGFAVRAEVPGPLRQSFADSVASAIAADSRRWFAMRLRAGVTPGDIDAAIAENAPAWRPSGTFYPMAEISKRVKGRRVTLQKPWISDVLFFKSRVTDILPLFRGIGGKAWCYRVTNTPGAPYAAIPQREMTRFQIAVGEFTPETEVTPLGATPLSPGDEVVVLGGILTGMRGTVGKPVSDRRTGRTLYRVVLQQAGPGGNPEGWEWLSAKSVEADIDPRQLAKAAAAPPSPAV